MFKFTSGVTKYRLEVKGKPAAPFRFRLVDAAADAMELGYAAPDRESRICLHETAEIAIFKNGIKDHVTRKP